MKLTKKQAQQFLLKRHGLIGKPIFKGKDGCLEFIRRVCCIQYDPVDICGRNADIVLNSRVSDYKKEYLAELLYSERKLVDWFDKNLAIVPIEDYGILRNVKIAGAYAEAFNARLNDSIRQTMPGIRKLIKERGFVFSKDVDTGEKIEWDWGALASPSRAALESMYFLGELIIHHKKGTNKSYALAKDHIPEQILNTPMPFSNEDERLAWLVKRRISGVGMLWGKASDAFLGLRLKSAQRATAYAQLLKDGEIFEVTIEGINVPFYICTNEKDELESILLSPAETHNAPRTEFIAPLDSLMWDRKLIQALFGFEYKWEIYTPKIKRKYGAYTLPILHQGEFIGRIDACKNGKELVINNIWPENNLTFSGELKKSINACIKRFAKFNNSAYLE